MKPGKLARKIRKVYGYEAYLKTDWWDRLKRRLLPVKCVGCQKRKAIVLHHVSYKNLGNERPDDLIPLCDVCHDRIHNALKIRYPSQRPGQSAIHTLEVWGEIFSGTILSVLLDEIGWRGRFSGCGTNKAKERKLRKSSGKVVCSAWSKNRSVRTAKPTPKREKKKPQTRDQQLKRAVREHNQKMRRPKLPNAIVAIRPEKTPCGALSSQVRTIRERDGPGES